VKKPRAGSTYTRKSAGAGKVAERYTHPGQTTPMRPEVGTQAQFRKKKPPRSYRYDSSLSPALAWDGSNSAREIGEWLIAAIDRASRLDPPHEFDRPQ
jgi:adenine-specific DNA-methyltransferase